MQALILHSLLTLNASLPALQMLLYHNPQVDLSNARQAGDTAVKAAGR
jgi:hypothetical protein